MLGQAAGGTTGGTGGFGYRLCVSFFMWDLFRGRRAGPLVRLGALAVTYLWGLFRVGQSVGQDGGTTGGLGGFGCR